MSNIHTKFHPCEQNTDCSHRVKNRHLSDRELINLYFDDKAAIENIRNSMGCNEAWYDKHYAISRTFTNISAESPLIY